MSIADPSPSPTSDHDSDCGHLREMYNRYMVIPSVAQWLLSRDACAHFQSVRRDKSVMVSVSSASPPRVIPQDTREVPFPASSDLMFLDHIQDGFAFGHIWGNLQSDSHPYAPLAARVGKSGWDRVQSRKFASDLTIDGTLEIVEYAWFADNRAMVILSSVPCQQGRRIVRTSEILFFDSVERIDMPPQRPALVLLLHDRSLCTTCGKEICCCPNAIGIDRALPPSCSVVQESTFPEGKTVPKTRRVQSWEDRARIVSHGNKRGVLSIVYNSSFANTFSQITVRQAYKSRCEDQDVIKGRIQQHLRKLLSRMPPMGSTVIGRPASGLASMPTFGSAQECGLSLTHEASSQSPMSFTRKEGNWFDSPRQSMYPHLQERPAGNCGREKQGSFPTAVQTVKLNGLRETVQGSTFGSGAEAAAAEECTTSRDERTSDKGSTSGAPEILPDAPNSHEARSEERDTSQGTLCGREKTGTECNCSAEKMQDSSLARILNYQGGRVVSRRVEDTSSFMEPNFASSPVRNNNILQPIPDMNPTALIVNMSRQEQRRVDQLPGKLNPYDNQSSNGTRCGASTAPQLSVQVEPPLKRPKTDSLTKSEPFGFGLEAGWQSSLDKILPAPAWNGAGGSIERPLSALGLAIGGSRSHSPFALMSSLAKTPSPSVPSVGGQGLSYGKASAADFDFNSSFDPSSNRSMTDFPKNANDHGNPGLRSNPEAASGIRRKSRAERSRNAGTVGTESGLGSGVSCDICGITFAKRSNTIRHIQTVHNRVKQFECDLCGAKFGLKADLGRHKFRIHESRAFRCERCGKSFTEQGQLEHHVRVTHEEDSKPWECKTCRMRFGRKSSLTRHEQTVHQQTRYECRFCKKSYSQKFDAVRHERKVHGVHDKVGSAGIKQLTS